MYINCILTCLLLLGALVGDFCARLDGCCVCLLTL